MRPASTTPAVLELTSCCRREETRLSILLTIAPACAIATVRSGAAAAFQGGAASGNSHGFTAADVVELAEFRDCAFVEVRTELSALVGRLPDRAHSAGRSSAMRLRAAATQDSHESFRTEAAKATQ